MLNAIEKIKCDECYGNGYIFYGDEDNFDVESCQCVEENN